MKTIIIYYSQTESTRKVAETLALSLKADICEVKDLKERDGLKNRFGLMPLEKIKPKYILRF